MISIIIASADLSLLKQVTKNIEETIAVPHEIIAFENSKGQKGICELYNLGIQKAKYETLCLMHEDIEILTNNWGQKVINIFHENPDVGLVGVAGNSYKTLTPTGWHGAGMDTLRQNFIQSFKHTIKKRRHYYLNPHNEKLSIVASVDGLWLCTTKKIASEFMFDEDTFKGFHAYDLDFSLAVGQKYKVAVTYDVLLHHFSEGRFDETWMKDNLKLHKKWNAVLPVNAADLLPEKAFIIEKKAFKNFIDQMIYFKYPLKVPLAILTNMRFRSLSILLFLKLNYHTLLRYYKADKPKLAEA